MRIVALRTSALGDSLLAIPALEALARAHPGAHLTFVTGEAQAPLFEGLTFLQAVVGWSQGERMADLARRLREMGPVDLYVDLQHKPRTVLLGRLLGARRRLTFRRRGLGGGLRALVGHDAVLAGRHATRLYLDALAPWGPEGEGPLPLRLPLPAGDALAGLSRPRVAIAPGARWATKHWPPERFAEVARTLRESAGASIVLVGGPGDREAAGRFQDALGAPADASTLELPLLELARILARCDLLVAGDTGPGHLAAALGVPVVSLFGPTAPSRWAPPGTGTRVITLALPCAPCTNHGGRTCPLGHHRCMLDLPAGRVAAEALEALAIRRSGDGP